MDIDFHQQVDRLVAEGQSAHALDALECYVADRPDDFSAWVKLATLRRRAGRTAAALEATNAALDVRSNDFLALLLKASLHEALADQGRAAEIYQAALYHAPLASEVPPPVRGQLDHAAAFVARYRDGVALAARRGLALDHAHEARCERFMQNVLERRPAFHQQPTHYRYPGLADVEFFDFAWEDIRTRLRKAFPAIRAEFERLTASHPERRVPYVEFAAGQPMGQWAPLNRSHDWEALHLVRYGERDPVNASQCPATIAALVGPQQPDIAGLAPNVMFSLLAPRTRIPPHHGVANFRAVLHLPLFVPAGCGFRVGSETRTWVEGEPWIFDDTIEHEAWNDSDQPRAILIADVWRPELDAQDRSIVRALVAAQDQPARHGAL